MLAAYCGWESRSSGPFAIDFLSPSLSDRCLIIRLSSLCEQLQAIVLGRILATAEPLHDKLMERSEFYRHCTEALMQRWMRSFRSIPRFGCQLCRLTSIIMQSPEVAVFVILFRYAMPRFLDPPQVPSQSLSPFHVLETSPLVDPL